MARILYWNISNFQDSTITAARGGKRKREDMEANGGVAGPQRLRMILDTLQPLDPVTGNIVDLDFIVIVEVYARIGAAIEGQPIGGGGRVGCVTLCDEIDYTLAGNWCMVPPIVTGVGGFREAIAVYYRCDRWYFLGPQGWPAAYPAALDNCLPAGMIPGGYPYRGGMQEDRGAGQWQFPNAAPAVPAPPIVNFPNAANRKPWLTAFGDQANAANLVRLIAMHTSPTFGVAPPGPAEQATAALADAWDITNRPWDAANQIDVLLGDFNIDNMDPANFNNGGCFSRLVGNSLPPNQPDIANVYTPLIERPAGLNAAYESYYHTHGRSAGDAENLGDAEIMEDIFAVPYWQRVGEYPGQRYSSYSIDNALVRYAVPPALAHNTTILSRARSQPYNAPIPPAVPPPMLGHYQDVEYMDETIPAIYALWNVGPPWQAVTYDGNFRFQEWGNYGLVYSTSDHFALVFDV